MGISEVTSHYIINYRTGLLVRELQRLRAGYGGEVRGDVDSFLRPKPAQVFELTRAPPFVERARVAAGRPGGFAGPECHGT